MQPEVGLGFSCTGVSEDNLTWSFIRKQEITIHCESRLFALIFAFSNLPAAEAGTTGHNVWELFSAANSKQASVL